MQIELKFTAANQKEVERLAQLFTIIAQGGIMDDEKVQTTINVDPAKKALKKPAPTPKPAPLVEPQIEEDSEDEYEDEESGEEFEEPLAPPTPVKKAQPAAKGPALVKKTDDLEMPKRGRGRPRKEETVDVEPEIEAPEDEPAKSKAKEPKYSQDDMLKAFQAKKDKTSALALLKEYNAVNVRALDPEHYSAVMKKLAKIV